MRLNYNIMLIVLLLLCSSSELCGAADKATYLNDCGLYALMSVNDDIGSSKYAIPLADPHLKGMSVRLRWNLIQPKSRREYDWSYIDKTIAFLKEYNTQHKMDKKLMLRVLTGYNTPDWVYVEGAQPFYYDEDNDGKRDDRIPVPWDAKYLEIIGEFIRAFGERYDKHPMIALVHISGPSRASAEMHLPKSDADKAQWNTIGYTPEKLTDAWRTVIEYYPKYFPDKPWALNISNPIWDDGVTAAVAEHLVKKYPYQGFLQINFMQEEVSPTFTPAAVWQKHCPEATHGGFQPVGTVASGRCGDLQKMVNIGADWGAVYWEPYTGDFQKPEWKAIWDAEGERIKGAIAAVVKSTAGSNTKSR